jgi:quinolinate synthase
MEKLPVIGNPSPSTTSEPSGLTDAELEAEIRRLKTERNAVILAHY